ncbi:MAG: hypothetical protein WBQ03_09630 [Candidatus Sulfotelmatobacter sp.]
MKLLACALLVVLFTATAALAQQRPIPPGIRQADQAEDKTQQNIPPARPQRTTLDMEKLRSDADELARIAQTIPPDVSNLRAGLLPKDMTEKLKQIEKLSKELRKRLNP